MLSFVAVPSLYGTISVYILGCATPNDVGLKNGAAFPASFTHPEVGGYSFAIASGLSLPLAVDQLTDMFLCAERAQ